MCVCGVSLDRSAVVKLFVRGFSFSTRTQRRTRELIGCALIWNPLVLRAWGNYLEHASLACYSGTMNSTEGLLCKCCCARRPCYRDGAVQAEVFMRVFLLGLHLILDGS